VARALQVEVSGAGRKEKLTTFDISAGGFAAPMGSAPEAGEPFTAVIRLPGAEPLAASVKVVGIVPMVGYFRVSFAFSRMDPASAERLDVAILDMVLQQLGPARPGPGA
jgi:c-di-GMP-binding flagellar brake protein YcgR